MYSTVWPASPRNGTLFRTAASGGIRTEWRAATPVRERLVPEAGLVEVTGGPPVDSGGCVSGGKLTGKEGVERDGWAEVENDGELLGF